VRILVDMNLSPEWLGVLQQSGMEAVHWKDVASPSAPDTELLAWAKEKKHVVVTQDIDFAQLLFNTQAGGPSVVLLRIRDELDSAQQARVCEALKSAASALEAGALLVIGEHRVRVRHLPIKADEP